MTGTASEPRPEQRCCSLTARKAREGQGRSGTPTWALNREHLRRDRGHQRSPNTSHRDHLLGPHFSVPGGGSEAEAAHRPRRSMEDTVPDASSPHALHRKTRRGSAGSRGASPCTREQPPPVPLVFLCPEDI